MITVSIIPEKNNFLFVSLEKNFNCFKSFSVPNKFISFQLFKISFFTFFYFLKYFFLNKFLSFMKSKLSKKQLLALIAFAKNELSEWQKMLDSLLKKLKEFQ